MPLTKCGLVLALATAGPQICRTGDVQAVMVAYGRCMGPIAETSSQGCESLMRIDHAVAEHVAEALTNRLIAVRRTTRETVTVLRASVLTKLGISTRAAVAGEALRRATAIATD